MKLLVLGGTKFLGRHLVEGALRRGIKVTLFHRGETNPDLFPDVERILGDRDGGLDGLAGRRWDAVVDTSGYLPRLVGDSARALADAVDHYTFVSTISVYRDFAETDKDETAPVGTLADPATETIDGDTYGPLKALCEQAAESALPGRVLQVRPGLIVGPNDPTNRFTYWVTRLARGGEVLAPLPRDRAVQVIDVRDLAEWTLTLVESGRTGIFNATGPAETLGLETFLDRARAALDSDATVTWVDEDFLQEREVGPWMELPLWIPGDPWKGLCEVNIDRALDAGLAFRPVEDTIRDTLAWVESFPGDPPGDAGLDPVKEAALLEAWRTRRETRPG